MIEPKQLSTVQCLDASAASFANPIKYTDGCLVSCVLDSPARQDSVNTGVTVDRRPSFLLLAASL